MVAGVGAIDVALFVVAADDGWMPQTEEHLHILTYLGIKRAIVALTKSDLSSNLEQTKQAIRNCLVGTPFADAPIIPTSAIKNTGFDSLKQALAECLAVSEPARDIGKPRLPVDRVFTLRGVGTVVTGTLMGGKLNRGQAVVTQPRGHDARIRSIQSHNAEIESATPGSRTALNIPDLHANESIQRGNVITLTELGKPTAVIDVVVHKLARDATDKLPLLARPVKTSVRIRMHLGTADVPATLVLLDQKEISAGETAVAQLRLESPTFAFIGDRFIIRDWAEQATLAGGVVLKPHGDTSDFRSDSYRQLLQTVHEQIHSPANIIAAFLARERIHRESDLLVQSIFSSTDVSAALSQLIAEKKAIRVGDWVAENAWWSEQRTRAANFIDAAHNRQPDAPGLPLVDLRAALELSPDLFAALIGELTQNGFSQTGDKIKRATHQLTLPPHLHAAGAKLRAALSAKPLDPPNRKDLAPDALSQQALRFLINSGEAVELDPQIALFGPAFKQAVETVRKVLANQPATVSEIRQVLGASRRVVVPLLEKLDRDGITRRDGDKRTLR
jgi:selenocysteine-specific elongation factor